MIGLKLAGWHMQTETVAVSYCLQFLNVPIINVDTVVGPDGAFGNRQPAIWDHQLRVNLQPRPQAGTDRASAVRTIKAKSAWFQLRNRHVGMVNAGVHQTV